MSVPSEMTAVAGAILTAVQWNTNVRDGINFLVNTKPFAILRQNVSQNTTSGAWAAITWDTEILNRDSMHSTTTNPTRLTANSPGYYSCESQIAWIQNGNNYRNTRYWVNGAGIQYGAGGQGTSTLFYSQTLAATFYLNVGDYVEVYGIQGSTATLATATLTDGDSMLTAEWVSTA